MIMKFECHLNFSRSGLLMRSYVSDFIVTQQYIENQPDKYHAVRKDDPETVFDGPTIGSIIEDIVTFTYNNA